MAIDFKGDLNPEQYLAATCSAQHLRIIAGAGTGKTRTLTYRLAYLVSRGDLKPREIVAITFTNKAAKEMADRARKILTENQLNITGMPTICTFHSFCYRFLRRELVGHFQGFTSAFTIADEVDQKAVYKKVAEQLNLKSDSRQFKDAVALIDGFKTKGIEWPEVPKKSLASARLGIDIQDLYMRYQQELAKDNMVDFDDLLIFTRDILQKDHYCQQHYQAYYKAFMIDEFQDTNDLQYLIVRLFMDSNCELCVVGDPDQTIYTWRGADNKIIKDRLADDFKDLQTITLDLNYRSTQKILDKANMLIKNNKNRIAKSLTSVSDVQGEDVDFINAVTNEEEAQTIAMRIKNLHTNNKVPYSQIAIIYRSNYLSRVFEKYLPRAQVPYILFDTTSFYERTEVKAGISYLRLLINTGDNISFENAIQTPSRKIGDKTIDSLYQQANNAQKPIFQFILEDLDSLEATPSVKEALKQFVFSYKKCLVQLEAASSPEEIAAAVNDYFNDENLISYFKDVDMKESAVKGEDNDNNRENNIKELVDDLRSYIKSTLDNPTEDADPSLTGFLINVALISGQDKDSQGDKVSVMTGHVSKGLEFGYVFVTGLVDGIFPTTHALMEGTNEAVEEERRLFYVAMTRAKQYLCVSTYGGERFGNELNTPSAFLKEIGFKAAPNNSGFMYSSRTDRQTAYGRAARENSRYGGDQGMYNQIDYYWKKKNYQTDDDSNFSSGTTSSGDYGIHKISGAKIERTGYSSAGANDVEYKPGDKIAHASFGVGVVKAVDGKKLTVEFSKDIGTKVLMAGFKAFKKI
jgi:DNA helicase-2/ATP-dependent DNA helicase PcrA